MNLLDLALAGRLAQNAKEAASVPTGDNLILEPKLDGWRILAEVHDEGVNLYARSGKTYSRQMPHLTEELAARFPAGTWLDGEVVSQQWGSVQSAMTRGVTSTDTLYAVFDILAFDGIDCRSLSFRERRAFLEDALSPPLATAFIVPQYPTSSHSRMLEMGYEGSVVKDLGCPYSSGRRGYGWTKLKPQKTRDVVVMAIKPGKRGPAGSMVFGAYDASGNLVELGSCAGHKESHGVDESWVGTVIEIAHHEVNEGAIRSPQFKRRRPDKLPSQCTV